VYQSGDTCTVNVGFSPTANHGPRWVFAGLMPAAKAPPVQSAPPGDGVLFSTAATLRICPQSNRGIWTYIANAQGTVKQSCADLVLLMSQLLPSTKAPA
jgi:hypothetical protein